MKKIDNFAIPRKMSFEQIPLTPYPPKCNNMPDLGLRTGQALKRVVETFPAVRVSIGRIILS